MLYPKMAREAGHYFATWVARWSHFQTLKGYWVKPLLDNGLCLCFFAVSWSADKKAWTLAGIKFSWRTGECCCRNDTWSSWANRYLPAASSGCPTHLQVLVGQPDAPGLGNLMHLGESLNLRRPSGDLLRSFPVMESLSFPSNAFDSRAFYLYTTSFYYYSDVYKRLYTQRGFFQLSDMWFCCVIVDFEIYQKTLINQNVIGYGCQRPWGLLSLKYQMVLRVWWRFGALQNQTTCPMDTSSLVPWTDRLDWGPVIC